MTCLFFLRKIQDVTTIIKLRSLATMKIIYCTLRVPNKSTTLFLYGQWQKLSSFIPVTLFLSHSLTGKIFLLKFSQLKSNQIPTNWDLGPTANFWKRDISSASEADFLVMLNDGTSCEDYKVTRFNNGQCALVTPWLGAEAVAEPSRGQCLGSHVCGVWLDIKSQYRGSQPSVAMLINSSEVRATGFKLRVQRVLFQQLEAAAQVVMRTCGAGLHDFEVSNPNGFALSVNHETKFRSRCEWVCNSVNCRVFPHRKSPFFCHQKKNWYIVESGKFVSLPPRPRIENMYAGVPDGQKSGNSLPNTCWILRVAWSKAVPAWEVIVKIVGYRRHQVLFPEPVNLNKRQTVV